MSLIELDLEELHTPQTELEDCSDIGKKKRKFSFGFYFVTFLAFQFASTFLILGLSDYKKCSADPRIRVWMILVGTLLCFERGIAIRRQWARSMFQKEKVEITDTDACMKRKIKWRNLKSRSVSQDFVWLLLVVLSMLGMTWLLGISSTDACDDIVLISVLLFSAIIMFSCSLTVFSVVTCFCCRKLCCCQNK